MTPKERNIYSYIFRGVGRILKYPILLLICKKKFITSGNRRSRQAGTVHEHYNSLFTDLQKIAKRVHSWDLPIREVEQGGLMFPAQATDLEKMQLLMEYHVAEQQREYTNWFIGLTIAIIVAMMLQILLFYI